MNKQLQYLTELLSDKTLSFGCVILNDVGVPENVVMAMNHDFKGYWVVLTDCNTKYRYADGNDSSEIKVIGHKVSLAAVMAGLGKLVFSLDVQMRGKFIEIEFDDKMETLRTTLLWNLGTHGEKTLEDQSEETISALYEVFKPQEK